MKTSAITGGTRLFAIELTIFVSLAFLVVTLATWGKAHRLATNTPVMATVAKIWSERTRSKNVVVYYAQLIFDRKQENGDTIHCDVPRVLLGQLRVAAGEAIKIAPRATSCWEPDIICETCGAPTVQLALSMLVISALSGGIGFILILRAVRASQIKAPDVVDG